MGASLEVTRKNEKNWRWALLTGNFQGVHGGAFLFRKEYSVNHSSLHEPFKGKKKKKFKGDVQRPPPWDDSELRLSQQGDFANVLKA